MDNPTYSAPFQPIFQSKLRGSRVTPLSMSAGNLYASAGSLHIPAKSNLYGSAGTGLHIPTQHLHESTRKMCGSAINVSCSSAAGANTGSDRNRVCASTTNIFGSGGASKSQCELLNSLDNPLYGSNVGANASRKVMSVERLFDNNSFRVHTVSDKEDKNDYVNLAADEYDYPLIPANISNREPWSASHPNSESHLTASSVLSDSEHIYELVDSSTTASTRVSINSYSETAPSPVSQQQPLLPKPM